MINLNSNNYPFNTILSILLIISILGYSMHNFISNENKNIDLSNIFLKSIKGLQEKNVNIIDKSDDNFENTDINNEYFFIKKNTKINKNKYNDIFQINKNEGNIEKIKKKEKIIDNSDIINNINNIKNNTKLSSPYIEKKSIKQNIYKDINVIEIEDIIKKSNDNKITTLLENNYYERDVEDNQDQMIENKLIDLNKHMENLLKLSNNN